MSILDDVRDPLRQEEVYTKSVAQVVGFLGNGRLTNGSDTSRQFRQFLGLIPQPKLADYANSCLDPATRFQQSGLALQDVLNEIGRRLGFGVEFGSYTGSQTDAAFDGLWTAPDGWQIIVEVKTTDAYRVKLARSAKYRDRLVAAERVTLARSSHLLVVGREDTGELEAQVRGSKYAWDMRLVSVEALLWLLSIRDRLDDESAVARITSVLKPEEYTKVDGIIKLVFDTTREAVERDTGPEAPGADPPSGQRTRTVSAEALVDVAEAKDRAVVQAEGELGVPLTRLTRSLARGPSGETVVVSYSKLHTTREPHRYWAALQQQSWETVRSAGPKGRVVVACAADGVLIVPAAVIEPLVGRFWRTERDDAIVYHLVVVPKGSRVMLLGSGMEEEVTTYFHRY